MKHQKNYSIFDKEKIVAFIVLVVFILVVGFVLGSCSRGEEQLATCWVMCKPGDYVNVRRSPKKNSVAVGYLECGDSFRTDAESKNGFIKCYGVGEEGEGWIYCGYVTTEEPVKVGKRYVCVAKKRVACRRWMNGPQTQNPWLRNGSTVEVFCEADGWAVTSRGYIRTEFLEVDPE